MIFDIDCESKIGYEFKDKTLLRKCFTHSSYAHEHGQEDNEMLEFFGDSIIEFVVTEYLYNNYSGDEGKLTKKRAEMVSKQPLLNSVKKLGLMDYVLLGHGLKNSLERDEKLFSSVYEAVVAGIYLDGGLAQAKKFIKNTIIKDFIEKEKQNKDNSNNGKNELQEYVQKTKIGSITYETLSKSGADHCPEFRVAVLINGKKLAEGKASSKKKAQALAATKALKIIKQGGKVK